MFASCGFVAMIVLVLTMLTTEGNASYDTCETSDIEWIKGEHIPKLTLYHDRMTMGHRRAPIPQLKCIGGTAGCHPAITPQVVHCYNRGSRRKKIKWDCKGEMDKGYKLGRKIEMSCEGYNSPYEEYLLKGSCGLSYKMYHEQDLDFEWWEAIMVTIGAVVLVILGLWAKCEEIRQKQQDDRKHKADKDRLLRLEKYMSGKHECIKGECCMKQFD